MGTPLLIYNALDAGDRGGDLARSDQISVLIDDQNAANTYDPPTYSVYLPG